MKRMLRPVMVLAVLWLAIAGTVTTVQAEEGRKVRVGYPLQPGLTDREEESYTGYTVDYLEELSRYTGWEYEYVEVEGDLNTQITTLLEMLQTGEIDLLGAMNRSEELEERYGYPSYSYGLSYTSLAVLENAPRWMEADYQNWNGIRVAVYPGVQHRLELLKEFARINDFTFETVECVSAQEIFQAVHEGRADAILQVDISMADGFRSIARFNPQPFYFATQKENTVLLKELNQGLYSLLKAYPFLQIKLYNKHFSYKGHFYMAESSQNYVKSLGTVKVLFFEGNLPVQDRKDGEAKGIADTFFKKISKEIGLSYEPVFVDSYEKAMEMIRSKEVDLVAAVPSEALTSTEGELLLSWPYYESYAIMVSNGVQIGNDRPDVSLVCENAKKRLSEMNGERGSIDLLDANSVSFYTRKTGLYEHLQFYWETTAELYYSVGATDGKFERLLNIINSYANNMTDDSRQEMLYENTHDPVQYSIWEIMRIYRWWFVGILVLLVIALWLRLLLQKNRKLQQELLANERVYQFSKLTHECLFEYDYKHDRMIIHNSQIFFPGEKTIEGFSRRHEQAKGKELHEVHHILNHMLQEKEELKEIIYQQDGIDRWYRIQIQYIGERTTYAIGRISDINREMILQKNLERQASTDTLTGLANRASAERYINAFLAGEDARGIMLLLDIDNFKHVNDTRGHTVGDVLLQEFADALRKCFRQKDLKARLGGDEFAVFLSDNMLEKKLTEKLRSVVDMMNTTVFSKYPECGLSLSMGAAYSKEGMKNYTEIYRMADNAMYVAKFGGKNDFFIAEDEVCMKKGCDNCKALCRRRDYLLARGVLQRDPENPERIICLKTDYTRREMTVASEQNTAQKQECP